MQMDSDSVNDVDSSDTQSKESNGKRAAKTVKPARRYKNRVSFTVEFKKKTVMKFIELKRKNSYLKRSSFLRTLPKRVATSTFNQWFKDPEIISPFSETVDKRKKKRSGDYTEVEKYLCKYLEHRERLFKIDKLGLNYEVVRQRVLDKAKELFDAGDDSYDASKFKASNRWILNVRYIWYMYNTTRVTRKSYVYCIYMCGIYYVPNMPHVCVLY